MKYYQCKYCSKLVRVEKAHHHMQRKHTENQNNCLMCKARYSSLVYNDHLVEVHKEDIIDIDQITICLKCNKPILDSEFYIHITECCQSHLFRYKCKKCNAILDYKGLVSHYSRLKCESFHASNSRVEPLTDEEYQDLIPKNLRNRNEILTPTNGQNKFIKRRGS